MTTKFERYDVNEKEFVSNPDVDAFFRDILQVITKHKLTISHEDVHGAFVVVRANKPDITWLINSTVNLGTPKKVKHKIPVAPKKEAVKPKERVKYKFYKPKDEK